MLAVGRYLTMLMLAALIGGCTLGIKSWPEPVEQQDAYSWRAVTPRLAGDCLIIEARLDGAFKNFQSVRLLAEPLGEEDCQQCPFKPTIVLEFLPGDPDFQVVGPWMKMQVCALDTTIPYRVRLVGSNTHMGMGEVESAVIRIDP